MRRLISLSAVFVLVVAVLAACNSMEKNPGEGANGSSNTGSSAASVSTARQNAGGSNASSTATPTTQPTPNDGVRRITLAELRDALDKGTAIVVDTRDANSYNASHIKGSINIPADQIANRINELPRDKLIVAYCS